MSPNRSAFLDMLAWSEIGPALLAISDRGYDVCVGSTPAAPILFHDYSTHPRIHCARLDSDAAGRYQLLGRYFEPYRQQLGLRDFGPTSQDLIALQLVAECHALPLIDAGRIEDAIHACRSRWASLPGAGYGQHEHALADLLAAYQAAHASAD